MFRLSPRLGVLTALLVHAAATAHPVGAGQPPTDTAVGGESTQPALDAVLGEASRVRVFSGGAAVGKPQAKDPVLERDGREDLKALAEALRIVDGGAGHCMCFGDPTFDGFGDLTRTFGDVGRNVFQLKVNYWLDF